jgi:hypothetical protein
MNMRLSFFILSLLLSIKAMVVGELRLVVGTYSEMNDTTASLNASIILHQNNKQ